MAKIGREVLDLVPFSSQRRMQPCKNRRRLTNRHSRPLTKRRCASSDVRRNPLRDGALPRSEARLHQ
jgi:hypothetical protein